MLFRKIYSKIPEIISGKHISFVVGPRQVGKTTLLRKMYDTLENTSNKQWLNLENIEYHGLFQSFSTLKNFIQSTYSGDGAYYLFLDEFQRVKNIDISLKLVYDELPFVKVIACGSNNIEINRHIKESFAGRKRMYFLWPLDFDEFILWKTSTRIEDLSVYLNNPINIPSIQIFLEEFMIWGGYPEVILARSPLEKERALEGIFDYWFNRDIILSTDKLFEFKELLKQLTFRMGNTVNYHELGALSHLSGPTIKRCIAILEEIFMIAQIRPFFRNKLKELSLAPKLYFYDMGFRNWFIRRYEFSPEEKGVLFENFMISELIKRGRSADTIKFWRTKNGQYEVDIILEESSQAIECKYRNHEKMSDNRGMVAFQKLYPSYKGNTVFLGNFWQYLK